MFISGIDTIKIIKEEALMPDVDATLALMQCGRDNPMYEELFLMYKELESDVTAVCHAKGIIAEGAYQDKRAIFEMITLGQKIVEYIDECRQRELLKGMLVDFMADSVLFEFDKKMACHLKEYCQNRELMISASYEPPDVIPLEIHKEMCELFDTREAIGVTCTDGFMLNPIKTATRIYIASDDCEVGGEFTNFGHDCGRCKIKKCDLRKVGQK